MGLFYAVSSSPHDFVFTASDDLLTCSKNVAVKVSFVFVVWKETCKFRTGRSRGNLARTPDMAVVTPLNNFLGPEGDTVTVDKQLLNTEY